MPGQVTVSRMKRRGEGLEQKGLWWGSRGLLEVPGSRSLAVRSIIVSSRAARYNKFEGRTLQNVLSCKISNTHTHNHHHHQQQQQQQQPGGTNHCPHNS
eukprot:534431-Pelagomonas_calceolata.AAC.9